MTKEEIKDFSYRISQCNKTELVVITYDIIINYLNSAKQCLNENNMPDYHFNLKKAKQFVSDLSSNLDFKYKMSRDLLSLYLYVNRTLLSADIKKDVEMIDVCIRVIQELRQGFDKISGEDKRGPAMPKSEQVYVGLTYGKSSQLNEVYMR